MTFFTQKLRHSILIAIIASSLTACAGNTTARITQNTLITAGPRIELEMIPGPFYEYEMHTLFSKYTVRPQIAVWLETLDGRYIGTIYATEASVTGKFKMAPKKGRPEALPVWSGRKTKNIDAVSAPTAAGKKLIYGSAAVSGLQPGRYAIMLETNRSYDWNKTYTKKNSGLNGQPSIVYRAELDIGSGSRTTAFEPIGTGSVDGSDARIQLGLQGIDTALQLFSSLQVTYRD